jgi:type II secretory pathway pseudopilin PulG
MLFRAHAKNLVGGEIASSGSPCRARRRPSNASVSVCVSRKDIWSACTRPAEIGDVHGSRGRSPSRGSRARRGFTYIELGVVMFMMVLIAAVVTPRFASLVRARRLDDFRDGLTQMVGMARETAISQGQSVDLLYVDADRRMQIMPTGSEDANQNPIRELTAPEGVDASKFQSDAGVESTASWTVRFYSDGTASAAAIEFNEGQETYSLVVSASGGAKTVDGEMPETQADDWEAGDYVHRTQ